MNGYHSGAGVAAPGAPPPPQAGVPGRAVADEQISAHPAELRGAAQRVRQVHSVLDADVRAAGLELFSYSPLIDQSQEDQSQEDEAWRRFSPGYRLLQRSMSLAMVGLIQGAKDLAAGLERSADQLEQPERIGARVSQELGARVGGGSGRARS